MGWLRAGDLGDLAARVRVVDALAKWRRSPDANIPVRRDHEASRSIADVPRLKDC
jgi:hypothetical protein